MNSRHGPLGPLRHRMTTSLLLVLTLLAAPLFLLAPAEAVTSTGLGTGHLWRGDNASWLGTYRLEDGRQAFCLEAGKSSPVGNHYDTETGSEVVGVSTADHARLAYIARTWGDTGDADTAAAGQLAVWTITGLNGHTQRYYAGRANERWPIVLERANQMLAEATAAASTSVTGSVSVDLQPDGTGSIRADLVVDRVGGGPEELGPAHVGTATLTGAVFADGSTQALLHNGNALPFTATGDRAQMTVTGEARFDDLPYGRVMTVGTSPAGSQRILFTGGVSVAASDVASVESLSPLPFRPTVSTATSDVVAEPGTVVTDQLTLDVLPGEGLLSEWGRYEADGTWSLVPVTVRSRLLGPFRTPVEPRDEWPADAPVVCDVAVEVLDGPGTYATPGCELPSGGWYTWVETIDPADTPAEAGRDRVQGWRSAFGTAFETTFVPWAPRIETAVVGDREVLPGSCVSDALDVLDGNPAAPEVRVDTLLVGPFTEAPAPGTDLGPVAEIDESLLAGRAETTIGADGRYEAPCIVATEPGHYVFLFTSDGSGSVDDAPPVVPAFADTTVHESESFSVVRPPAPSTPPAAPPAPAESAPAALAFTGGPDGLRIVSTAVGIVLAGLALVAAASTGHVLRRRRRESTGPAESAATSAGA
ncbi:hypothetical protein EDF38_1910 [Frigoribacterium sp. PhB160]|uniref:thioester domain-containing protein n=1 Tax=Frigoribacterium sp. PhB160 TaxID=2485192 RepID=UPI000FC207EE|nr:thioester domain-containing protein [Frigoribacterium sp. PhB160]ROS59070.1 hypothetical protein EDF38_1910 [Frigoribacterium sp. PhB160]